MTGDPDLIITKHINREILNEFKDKQPHEAVYKEWSKNTEARHKFHLKWIVDLKFLNGDQWLAWYPRSRIIDRVSDFLDSKRPDIVRAVANRMLPAYDHKHGRMCEVLHVPQVIPQAGRPDFFETAEVQTQFLQALWWKQELDDVDEAIKGFSIALGHAWIKCWFDYDEGLPKFKGLTPFEVLPIPYGITNVTEAIGIIETRAVPLDELRNKYPEGMNDYDERTELQEEKSTLIASTDSFLIHEGEGRSIKGMVPVRECYRLPNKKHPRGYKAVVTRKRTLSIQPLKHPDWRVPYFQVRYRYFPGAMYPDGMIYPNIPMQVLRNKSLSTRVAHLHNQGRPHLMIPDGLNIDPAKFDDMGHRIEYQEDEDPAMVPWYLQSPSLDVDHWRMTEELDRLLDDGMQLHDPSRGVQQPNVQSGTQLQGLQVQDDVHLGPALGRFARVWARVFEYALRLHANEQDKNKPVTLPGVDLTTSTPFAVEDFVADQESPSYRVWVRTIGRGPVDQLVSDEKNMKLLQYQKFNDVPDNQVREIIGKGLDGSLFTDKNRDRVGAKYENVQILKGDPNVQVESWEDHEVHLDELRKMMLSLRYKQSDRLIKQAAVAHMQSHISHLQRMMEGQGAMNAEMAGEGMEQQQAQAPAGGGLQDAI